MLASNTSPLIALIQLRKLALLERHAKRVLIPKEVLHEIRKGPEKDVAYFESFARLFETVSVKKRLRAGLSKAEEKAIQLARERRLLLLLDEKPARVVAQSLGVNALGTLGLLLLFQRKKWLSKRESKACLSELVDSGFRISIELYARTMQEFE